MAINENTARNAEHWSVCMLTGGGKGVALNNLNIISPKYPVLILDPHREYKKIAGRKVFGYKTKRGLAKALKAAWKSGKPFALAYQPRVNAQDEKARKKELKAHAHWFGRLVWEISDGNRIVYAVFEEYGEYSDGVGTDTSIIGQIWTGGRKFGIRAIALFQRSASVSKTIWLGSPNKVIGVQGGLNDQERVIKELGCTKADVIDLGVRNKALEMFAPELDERVRTKVHYLLSHSSGQFEKVACYVPQSAYLRPKWSQEQRQVDKNGGYRLVA